MSQSFINKTPLKDNKVANEAFVERQRSDYRVIHFFSVLMRPVSGFS